MGKIGEDGEPKLGPDGNMDVERFTIPFGNWESWSWYRHAISEVAGLELQSIRIIFAGS